MTNCRWGMMVWTLVVVLFWMKSLKSHGFVDSHFVTMILIVSYLAKFFWWEAGYMKTIDICVDRAGWYLCYGCLCFVPLFYALPSIYLAYHPVVLGWKMATCICSFGFLSLYVNYDADSQRYLARETDGKCLIWNREPKVIRAKYILLNGIESENLLLASGYWGLSRHFHYLPELCLAFSWCTTAAFESLLPYLYFIFLTVLLVHRSIRDDDKCSNKYGKYWIEYKRAVPYKIIPYVY
jgi:7-dehydrocholesterol reductase